MAEYTLTPTQSEQIESVAEYRGEDSDGMDADAIEAALTLGECAWCDDYSGEYPGRHASSAHPDEWEAYKDD